MSKLLSFLRHTCSAMRKKGCIPSISIIHIPIKIYKEETNFRHVVVMDIHGIYSNILEYQTCNDSLHPCTLRCHISMGGGANCLTSHRAQNSLAQALLYINLYVLKLFMILCHLLWQYFKDIVHNMKRRDYCSMAFNSLLCSHVWQIRFFIAQLNLTSLL